MIAAILIFNITFCSTIFAAANTNAQVKNRPSFVGNNGCLVSYKTVDKENKGVLFIHAQDYYLSLEAAQNFADDLTTSRTESLIEYLSPMVVAKLSPQVAFMLETYFFLDNDGQAAISQKIKKGIQKSCNDGNGGYVRITVEYYENKAGGVSMTTYDVADWNGGDIDYLDGFRVDKIYRLN